MLQYKNELSFNQIGRYEPLWAHNHILQRMLSWQNVMLEHIEVYFISPKIPVPLCRLVFVGDAPAIPGDA